MELDDGKCHCGATYKVTLADAGSGQTKCLRGHVVVIDSGDSGRKARAVQKSMDDLDKALDGLGRTFKI